MKLIDLFEGKMKRSDPFISGERDPKHATPSSTKHTSHEKKLMALAAKAGVSVHDARKAWDDAKDQVDPKLENRWMIVMRKAKENLGLVE